MVTAMVAGVIMPLLLEIVVKEQAYRIIFLQYSNYSILVA